MNPNLATRAAQLRAHKRAHELAHYEAAARTTTHEDVREIVRLWRNMTPTARARVTTTAPPLGHTLDALIEGWRQ